MMVEDGISKLLNGAMGGSVGGSLVLLKSCVDQLLEDLLGFLTWVGIRVDKLVSVWRKTCTFIQVP